MAYLNDVVLDAALSLLDTATCTLHICSAEPAAFANVATYTLGNKAGISIGAPADASPNGRMVTVAVITDGAVTATGTAAYYAIVDTVNSRVLATSSLSASQGVTIGNVFTLAAFNIRIPDAV